MKILKAQYDSKVKDIQSSREKKKAKKDKKDKKSKPKWDVSSSIKKYSFSKKQVLFQLNAIINFKSLKDLDIFIKYVHQLNLLFLFDQLIQKTIKLWTNQDHSFVDSMSFSISYSVKKLVSFWVTTINSIFLLPDSTTSKRALITNFFPSSLLMFSL